MPDPLNIATSGLLAMQRALATSSNNIVNVNTEGYTRQSVSFEQQPTQKLGRGFIGNGVSSGVVKRSYDQFLTSQVQSFSSSEMSLSTTSDLAARLDNVMGDPATGLGQDISNFFGSLNSLANNPASTPERRVVIAEAEAMATQIRFLDNSLSQFTSEVVNRLQSVTSEINELAENIARINGSIVSQSDPNTGVAPNELLDQRDLLLTELSGKVGISIVDVGDGSVNVFVGSGQPLIVGTDVSRLATTPNAMDTEKTEIIFEADTSQSSISSSISGGELKGLLNFRDQILEQSRNQLGLLATGIAGAFNAQHRQGVNLDGTFGGDLFTPSTAAAIDHPGNVGAATVSVAINNFEDLEPSDYRMRFDGTNWQVIRESDGQSSSYSGSFGVDGLDVTIAGGAATSGDTFLLRVTRNAALGFGVLVSRPAEIAAASSLLAAGSDSNLGSANLSELDASITSPLASDVIVTFDPDALGAGVAGFNLTGGVTATLAYDPATESVGKDFSVAGIGSFAISGVPVFADSFVIRNNVSGAGDNTNALRMVQLQDEGILEGGRIAIDRYYGDMVAEVGVGARQSEVNAETERVLLEQAIAARDGVSGVNLDEEAANLLKLQQAYQAAAQIVGVADTMFQTLLLAASR